MKTESTQNLKIEKDGDLEAIAQAAVKAVNKNRWDLKDFVYYFEQDNGFDYKVRVKIWEEMDAYTMPKTYENILKLLTAIVEGNKK